MLALEATDVRRAFVNSSRSRAAAATFPIAWPPADVAHLDFLGWTDAKAPLRAYLVVGPEVVEDGPVAVELRLGASAPGPRATMCDWCHAADAEGGARLVVAPRAGARGRSGDTVGVYVCADFGCSRRVRRPLKDHQRSVSGMPDTRVADLVASVRAFVDRVRER